MMVVGLGKPRPGVPMEKVFTKVREEVTMGWDLYSKGIFRQLLYRHDEGGVVIIMEVKDMDEAKRITAKMPMVEAGLTEWELIPVGPFTHFEALFPKE